MCNKVSFILCKNNIVRNVQDTAINTEIWGKEQVRLIYLSTQAACSFQPCDWLPNILPTASVKNKLGKKFLE